METKKRSKPNFTYNKNNEDEQNKFTSWLHSRKEFKEAAKARTTKFVSVDNIAAIKAEIKAKLAPRLQMLAA